MSNLFTLNTRLKRCMAFACRTLGHSGVIVLTVESAHTSFLIIIIHFKYATAVVNRFTRVDSKVSAVFFLRRKNT